MQERICECINILGDFCGTRDIEELTKEALKEKYCIDQVDVMVLFGGSIMCGADELASAIRNKVAKKFIIVGGAGHTTETLRKKVHAQYPSINTEGLSEAEVFDQYLQTVYGLKADYLETRSTNCGNNITYLLELLKSQQINCKSIIICQDATMQRRMDAGLGKYVNDVLIINYASYHAHVIVSENELTYSTKIKGMWNMERYIELLLGEIPRLSDDEQGYGPNGKDYIAHVDLPEEVKEAFLFLKENVDVDVRKANPLYASC